MSIKASMWVHGTIAEVEDPASLTKTVKTGSGTIFTGKFGKSAWFHFPITTPAILDAANPGVVFTNIPSATLGDDSPQLTKVYIFYKTFGFVESTYPTIKSVHLYDGGSKIKAFDNLNLSGDHAGKPDANNSWEIGPSLKIKHGLGVSVNVKFPPKNDSKTEPFSSNPDILFTAVGADF